VCSSNSGRRLIDGQETWATFDGCNRTTSFPDGRALEALFGRWGERLRCAARVPAVERGSETGLAHLADKAGDRIHQIELRQDFELAVSHLDKDRRALMT